MKATSLPVVLLLTIATAHTYAQSGGNLPDNASGKSSTSPKATHVAPSKRVTPAGRSNELTISSESKAASAATGQGHNQQKQNTAEHGSGKQSGKVVNQQAAGPRKPIGTSTSSGSRQPVRQ
ncbi:hypothetical protein [Spirosoma koreense]